MFKIKLAAGAGAVAIALTIILCLCLQVAIVSGATWLCCYLLGYAFTWQLAAVANIIYLILPKGNSSK